MGPVIGDYCCTSRLAALFIPFGLWGGWCPGISITDEMGWDGLYLETLVHDPGEIR